MRVTSADVEQTQAWGRALGRVLRKGDLVVLTGQLGAGKTAFTQGIGDALGVRGQITSPTFVIARVHPADPDRGGSIPLLHADAYRLGSALEVDDLDLDADLADMVTVIEWGAGIVEQLAESHLEIQLTPDPATERRELVFLPSGGDWRERLADLRPLPAAV